jgi:hypothetical protein
VQIIRPHKELKRFWPNDQPQRFDMLAPYESQILFGFGSVVARIFSVDLINDLEYDGMPEESKASYLSVVLTRAEVKQTGIGIYEWDPIVVVVKYTIFVAVHCQLDVSKGQLLFKEMILWNNRAQEYAPIVDPKLGYIEDPRVLLTILERYAQYEGLASKAQPTPVIIKP